MNEGWVSCMAARTIKLDSHDHLFFILIIFVIMLHSCQFELLIKENYNKQIFWCFASMGLCYFSNLLGFFQEMDGLLRICFSRKNKLILSEFKYVN